MLWQYANKKSMISLKSQIKTINMKARFSIFNAQIDTLLQQLTNMMVDKMSKIQFTK